MSRGWLKKKENRPLESFFSVNRRRMKLRIDKEVWLRMLPEGATRTFEGWYKDQKWNTSLFHLTVSLGALFLTDWEMERILRFSRRQGE